MKHWLNKTGLNRDTVEYSSMTQNHNGANQSKGEELPSSEARAYQSFPNSRQGK